MRTATRIPHAAAKAPGVRARPPGAGSATARALAEALADAPGDWAARAVCGYGSPYPPELWWPGGDTDQRGLVAREVCRTCPVRPECLAYAEVAREPTGVSHGGGIWGGLTDRERVRERGKGWRPGKKAPAIPVMTDRQAQDVMQGEWARWLPAAFLAGVAARWQAEQRKAG